MAGLGVMAGGAHCMKREESGQAGEGADTRLSARSLAERRNRSIPGAGARYGTRSRHARCGICREQIECPVFGAREMSALGFRHPTKRAKLAEEGGGSSHAAAPALSSRRPAAS